MANFPRAELGQILSEANLPGSAFVHVEGPRLQRRGDTPAEAICLAVRECLPKVCSSFYEDLSQLESLVRRTCPLGIEVVFAPLQARDMGYLGILVPAACRPTALPKDLAESLPRKQKKRLKGLLSGVSSWQHPAGPDLADRISAALGLIDGHLRAAQDSALQETIFSYKDFVASFCHEALSPIQEIRTTLERAAKRVEGDGESHRLVTSAKTALDKVRTALEGMRLLFNADTPPLPNRFQRVDARKVVEHWGDIYAAQMTEKNLDFIVEPRLAPWYISVVPEYFEVLVRNLFTNAIKYSFDAQGYDEPGKVLVRFDSAHCRLTFVNFGVPISESEIASGALFELSQRGKAAGDRGRTGKGVGLYLVQLVASHHKTKVDVLSRVQNPGGNHEFARTEFSVAFPRVNSATR